MGAGGVEVAVFEVETEDGAGVGAVLVVAFLRMAGHRYAFEVDDKFHDVIVIGAGGFDVDGHEGGDVEGAVFGALLDGGVGEAAVIEVIGGFAVVEAVDV